MVGSSTSSSFGESLVPAPKHHALLGRGGRLAEGLAFAVAVQEFRELCRHDLSISSEKVSSLSRSPYRACCAEGYASFTWLLRRMAF